VDGSARSNTSEEFVLLPYQSAWVEDESFTKVSEKGRQQGYSWATACEAVMVASTRKGEGGLDVYYMSTGQGDARDFINECMRWIVEQFSPIMRAIPEIEEFDWIDDEDPVSIQTFRIRFPSGFSIYALPSRPARMRGKKRCLAILDEAAQNDLDAWLKATGALKFWGGRRAIISTHFGSDTAFYKYVQKVKASIADGKPMASLHSVFLMEALRQGLYRRACRLARPQIAWTQDREDAWVEELRIEYADDFDEECLGIVAGASNQLIGRPIVQAAQTLERNDCPIVEICGGDNPRMWINGDLVESAGKPWPLPTEQKQDIGSPEEREQLVRGWLDTHLASILMRINALGHDIHVGDDYGRTGDISCKIIGTNDSSNRRAVRLVIECDRVPFSVQSQIADYCWPLLSRLRSGSGDGNGNGSQCAERAKDMTRNKMVVTMRLPDSAFTRLRTRLEHGEISLPRHGRDLADDLTSIKRKGTGIYAPQRRTDRGQQRHADGAYALAHFEHSIDTDGRIVQIADGRRRRKPLISKPTTPWRRL
jgi:phage FluMu gp28-like protein